MCKDEMLGLCPRISLNNLFEPKLSERNLIFKCIYNILYTKVIWLDIKFVAFFLQY